MLAVEARRWQGCASLGARASNWSKVSITSMGSVMG
jgi:hypothetical protein